MKIISKWWFNQVIPGIRSKHVSQINIRILHLSFFCESWKCLWWMRKMIHKKKESVNVRNQMKWQYLYLHLYGAQSRCLSYKWHSKSLLIGLTFWQVQELKSFQWKHRYFAKRNFFVKHTHTIFPHCITGHLILNIEDVCNCLSFLKCLFP